MYISISQLEIEGIIRIGDDSSDVEEVESKSSEPSPSEDALIDSLRPQWLGNLKAKVILRL
jgi:hypothetical protein